MDKIEKDFVVGIYVVASVLPPRREDSLGSVSGVKGLVFMSGGFMSDA